MPQNRQCLSQSMGRNTKRSFYSVGHLSLPEGAKMNVCPLEPTICPDCIREAPQTFGIWEILAVMIAIVGVIYIWGLCQKKRDTKNK